MLLVTSATAAATATATAASAVTELPFRHRACFIHSQTAAAELTSVELLDRLVRVCLLHDNKSKTFGSAGVSVSNNRDGFHGTELREYAVEFFFRRLKR